MDLQKKLFMKKLAQAENSGTPNGMSQFSSEAQDELTPLRPPSPPVHHPKSPTSSYFPQASDLPSWNDFFESETTYVRGSDKFKVFYTPPSNNDAPVFVFHHGAGSSALTFAPLAKELNETFKNDKEGAKAICGVMAFDCRGHGETEVSEENFNLINMVEDSLFVLKKFVQETGTQKNSIFLIGHSLGGSVFTKACYDLVKEGMDIKGLGMFDIVEDTAVHSLQGMHTYLSNVPKSFASVTQAVEWHLKSGLLRNKTSAEISVPPLLKKTENGNYTWRIDLSRTAKYWDTWFTGLSKSFVSAPTSKLLILAGTDSLDRELMIGQMQGKYQLVVFQDSGHFIQEDVPRKTAITLLDFWKRNDKKVVVIKSTWGAKN